MNRLRVQLTIAFTLTVLVTVGVIAVLIFQSTNIRFRQYITHSGMIASGSGMEELVNYYEQHDSWEGIDVLLDQGVIVGGPSTGTVSPKIPRPGMAGGRLESILSDASGKIVYDSEGEAEGRTLKSSEKSQALPLTRADDDQVIGYLLLSLPSNPDRFGLLEQQFIEGIKRLLFTGAVLAVAVGLVLGLLLSRRLTAPLQRLAQASRAVAGGDLDQQVPYEGSSEVIETAQAFNEMTDALRESERQRQNLVADVAHELRTPLTVLQGNLQAIKDGVYQADKSEIARLYDETRLMSRMVDDLRELALADAGQLRLNLYPTNVADTIRFAVDNLAQTALAHQLVLSSKIDDDLPLVQVDSDRLSQVLRNLLVNAVHYTPPGGTVTVSATSGDDVVEIVVSDTGEGIAAEDLPYIFERFWRADPARTRNHGTGLGLSVAQSLVEAQGGRIWAESTLGKGSSFHIVLPI